MMLTLLCILLGVCVLIILLFPSHSWFVEPFDVRGGGSGPGWLGATGQGHDQLPKVKTISKYVVGTVPSNQTDDFIAKSSLVPCVCPTYACPVHQSASYRTEDNDSGNLGMAAPEKPVLPNNSLHKRFLSSMGVGSPSASRFSAF